MTLTPTPSSLVDVCGGDSGVASASVRPEPTQAVACPHCERTVATANDLYNHVKAKHGAKLARKLPRPKVEREQSVGEWLADALADYAAGIEPPQALMLMFPEQFREVRRVRDRR